MKTKTLVNILCITALIFMTVSVALFIDICSTRSGVIDLQSDLPLFVSTGVICALTLLIDVIIGTFMGMHKYKAVYGFSTFSLILSIFVSLLILLMLFSA